MSWSSASSFSPDRQRISPATSASRRAISDSSTRARAGFKGRHHKLAPKNTREASGRSGNPSPQVRIFRDVFLIAELLDSKAESDDVGLERSRLGCSVRSSGLSGLLRSSKKPPPIHQTE